MCGACVEEPGRPPGTDAFAPASGMRANGGGGVRGVSVGRARSDRRRLDRARSGIERTFAGNDAARETAGSSGRAKTRAAARRPRHTRETRTFGLARAEHRALCSSQGASRVVDWRHAPRQFGSSEKTRFWEVFIWRAACRGFGGSAVRGFHMIFATEKRAAAKTARARAEPREPAARLSDGGEAPAVALTGARACCSYRRRESARVVRIDIKRKRSRSFQSRRRVARPASSRSSRSPPKRILSTPHASDALMSLRCEP